MLKELEEIDTTSVTALADLNRDSATVQELTERARAQKEGMPEAVVQRVLKDYADRLKALDGRARPLREKARAELARLRQLRLKVKGALEALLLDQQELKFRLQIGELKPEDFEPKEKNLAGLLAEAQENFDSVERVFEQFAAVLPTEAAAPIPSSQDSPPAPSGAPVAEDDEAGPTVEVPGPDVAAPTLVVPGGDASKASSTERTTVLELDAPDGSSNERTTVMLPLAHLVLRTEGTPETRYPLSAVTTIGRTNQNHIALEKPEVSRHHATISMTDAGWLLKDLGSGNGTFVNDARVTEHSLQDGDEIVIGTVHLLFRDK
jgi:hypothetical protein